MQKRQELAFLHLHFYLHLNLKTLNTHCSQFIFFAVNYEQQQFFYTSSLNHDFPDIKPSLVISATQ